MQKNKLYVGNLPYSCDESQLDEIFSGYGNLDEVKLIRDRETGRSKGFAFITFADQAGAEGALEKDGQEVGGRNLRVNFAKEREDRGGR